VKLDPNLAFEGFGIIKPLLKDEELCISFSASEALGEIVKSDPKLAVESLSLIKPLFKDIDIDNIYFNESPLIVI
jgi:3-methyladenine DNA glycosylase AlkD